MFSFPHYMWGYIGLSLLQLQTNKVPSLYVRVYRLKKLVGTRSERSIIICEGISQEWVKPKMNFLFPHYMWGYISSASLFSFISFVPSLYVRVYRHPERVRDMDACSLIICEGISMITCSRSCCLAFPHYMWGYIAGREVVGQNKAVPSLYVRVYRHFGHIISAVVRSLIICEGISLTPYCPAPLCLFPHYMWGYIA